MKALIVSHLASILLYGRVPKRLSDRIRKKLEPNVLEILKTVVTSDFVTEVAAELKKEEADAKDAKEKKAAAKAAELPRVDASEGNPKEVNTSEATSKGETTDGADAKTADATEPRAKEPEKNEESAKTGDSGTAQTEPPADVTTSPRKSRRKRKDKPDDQGDFFEGQTP
jgi:hypothetical protein